MKKLRFCLIMLMGMIFIILSCAQREFETNEDSNKVEYIEDEETRERLLELLKIGNEYTLSEDEVKGEINSLLKVFKCSEENNEGSAQSREFDDEKSLEFEIVHSIVIDEFNNNRSDSSNSNEGKVAIEVYNVYDASDVLDEKSKQPVCFVIMPNDRRLGNAFFISDAGGWEGAEECENFRFLLEGFIEYSKEVAKLWNELETDPANERAAYKSKIQREEGSWESIKEIQLTTVNWNQGGSFNDAIEACKGANLLVGCGAVATATIMAYWSYPSQFVKIDWDGRLLTLNDVKEGYSSVSNWNGSYDWASIKSGENTAQRAVFLLDVAEGCCSNYGTSGTSSSASSCGKCLKQFGFLCDSLYNLDISAENRQKVISSIEKYGPVFAAGDGHGFILDGGKGTKRDIKYTQYDVTSAAVTKSEVLSSEDKDCYLHANLGWGGSSNGWYNAGSVAGKYRCSVIWYNIRPNNI